MKASTAGTLQKLINSKKFNETLGYLASRWQDEKQYENINDYAKPLTAVLPSKVVIDKMVKQPFGFVFHMKDDNLNWYQCYVYRNGQWGFKGVTKAMGGNRTTKRS